MVNKIEIHKASPKLRHLTKSRLNRPQDSTRQYAAVKMQAAKKQYSVDIERGRLENDAETDTSQVEMNVYLHLDRESSEADSGVFELQLVDESIQVYTKGAIGIATVTEKQFDEILAEDTVSFVDIAEAIKRPLVLRDEASIEEPDPVEGNRIIGSVDLHQGGEGVLIGIIDVEGFDFSHEDFIDDAGRTRYIRIWDQGPNNVRPAPDMGPNLNYGCEFHQEHLNKAIEGSAESQIAAFYLEKQSAMVSGSHGTHVASIAAGKHGICPKSDIAAVLIHLPERDWERQRAFTDSTRIAHAVEYLLRLKDEIKDKQGNPIYKAVSINISLGTNGHAHDGTSGACRWIDAEMDRPGRAISIAAGNSGQEEPESIDDLGFVVGRIHTSGRISATGLTKDITLRVAGFPIEDVSENEIEIWYPPQDRLSVSIRPPGGQWGNKVRPGNEETDVSACDNRGGPCGTKISIYNKTYKPENGANHISVFLTPDQSLDSNRVLPGIWTIRLHGEEIRDGHFHGWVERDDPIPVQGITPQAKWHYPAFFTRQSNIDNTSLSTLACTRTALAIANLNDQAEAIAVTSSQGPTRDLREKPELCAPGTNIAAACGFSANKSWIQMSGTSMASPFVAGIAGLMLSIEPSLTIQQIRGIMVRTAQPLPGGDYRWKNDSGFGRIDAERCIIETKLLSDSLNTEDSA